MKKVKITILKTTLDKELAAEYGIAGLTACPMMKAGDVFYADYAKPQGFCDEAWKAIYQYVFALAHGADKSLFYYGDWIKKPGVAIVSCNDGLRPVIMKLEATAVPRTSFDDALHISVAAIAGMDFLLSWNCRHIANPETRPLIRKV